MTDEEKHPPLAVENTETLSMEGKPSFPTIALLKYVGLPLLALVFLAGYFLVTHKKDTRFSSAPGTPATIDQRVPLVSSLAGGNEPQTPVPFEMMKEGGLVWMSTTFSEPHSHMNTSILVGDDSWQLALAGTEWSTQVGVSCEEKVTYSYEREVVSRLAAWLEDNGWEFEHQFDEVTVRGLDAGGPLGEMFGYARTADGRVRVIQLGSGTEFLGTCEPDPSDPTCHPTGGKCPLKRHFSVFVSDEYTPERLLEMYREDEAARQEMYERTKHLLPQ